MTDPSTWPERLKARREELGKSILEVADAAGREQSLIYRYERGDVKDPTRSAMIALAEALQSKPCELFFDDCDAVA